MIADSARLDERPAAEEMPVGVVDLLEPIEVDEQQRQRLAGAHGPFAFPPEHLGQIPRVVELGQIVGDGQRLGALHPRGVIERDGGRLEHHPDGRTDVRRNRRYLRGRGCVYADDRAHGAPPTA